MRHHAIRLGYCALLVLAALMAGRPTPVTAAPDDTPPVPVLRIQGNDTLTPRHLARLTVRSATARDLVVRLERVPKAVFILRAHPLLANTERLLGRGQFWVERGRLYGLLEYQAEPIGSTRALLVLAHELAHALEVGTLPRASNTRSLRSLLRVRELDEGFDSAPGIETDFARAVTHRVYLEIFGRLPNATGLMADADAAHVTLPALPGDGLAKGR
jgi:hypothetical protein